jgi:ferredoxin--NADP+ reductase
VVDTEHSDSLLLATPSGGHTVLGNVRLAADVHRLEVIAPRIAAASRPGQFVIVRLGPGAERIPLTVAGADRERASIDLVVQAVGKSTRDLVRLHPDEVIADIAGPLGRPPTLVTDGHAVCVAGGVGAAVVLPIARGLRRAGATVTTVLGARTADRLVLADDLSGPGPVLVCTEDGSQGRRGQVTDVLTGVLDGVSTVYAAGPVPMMQAVAELTRPLGIPTIVSLNPIMVDGTGMCGGCRLTIAGRMRFACVDGPEFDGHQVDFDELADRLTTYRRFERAAVRHATAIETTP